MPEEGSVLEMIWDRMERRSLWSRRLGEESLQLRTWLDDGVRHKPASQLSHLNGRKTPEMHSSQVTLWWRTVIQASPWLIHLFCLGQWDWLLSHLLSIVTSCRGVPGQASKPHTPTPSALRCTLPLFPNFPSQHSYLLSSHLLRQNLSLGTEEK